LKGYKKSEDIRIKEKIKKCIDEWAFDLKDFEQKLSQSDYKYKQKDWKIFFDRAGYFFELHKGIRKSFLDRDKYYYLDRVYLGCGFEFLLKAVFLKKGYLINKYESQIDDNNGQLKNKFNSEQNTINKLMTNSLIEISNNNNIQIRKITQKAPIKIWMLTKPFLKRHVQELGYFIDRINKIKPSNVEDKYFDYYVLAGLKIAQSWRNQDIHTPTGLRRTNGEYQNLLKYSHDILYKLFFPKEKIPKFNCY